MTRKGYGYKPVVDNWNPNRKKHVKVSCSQCDKKPYNHDPKHAIERRHEGKFYDRSNPKWKKLCQTNVSEDTSGENSQTSQ